MRSRRAIEAFEPVLIEERGEGRLAELRLPDDAEQRRCRLIPITCQGGENCSARSGITIDGVGAGPEPEIDQPPALGRRQSKMSDLV